MDCDDRPQKVQGKCQTNAIQKRLQVNPWSIRSGSKAIWVVEWTDWFEGLTITLEENGDTLLTGPVVDQAALHGLLKKVRDLGMPLVSVCPLESTARWMRQTSNRKWIVSCLERRFAY